MVKIIFFGDIVGKTGRGALKKVLPKIRKKYEPDLVLANVENLAHGSGVTEKTLKECLEMGVDVFTSGNHVFDRQKNLSLFNEKKYPLIRPANYPPQNPGEGFRVFPVRTNNILVINLVGRVFFREDFDCPFRVVDEIVRNHQEEAKIIIVDFHAEATSEKIALSKYLNGRVSAVLGTHTHVPTADLKISPEGTAFAADLGMVGAADSVLGFDKNIIVERFLTQRPIAFEVTESNEAEVDAVYLEINRDGKVAKFKRIDEKVTL